MKKTLLKTLSWRTVGIVEMTLLAYFVTGKASAALGFAAVSFLYKAVLYYGHEVAWDKLWKTA